MSLETTHRAEPISSGTGGSKRKSSISLSQLRLERKEFIHDYMAQ